MITTITQIVNLYISWFDSKPYDNNYKIDNPIHRFTCVAVYLLVLFLLYQFHWIMSSTLIVLTICKYIDNLDRGIFDDLSDVEEQIKNNYEE